MKRKSRKGSEDPKCEIIHVDYEDAPKNIEFVRVFVESTPPEDRLVHVTVEMIPKK